MSQGLSRPGLAIAIAMSIVGAAVTSAAVTAAVAAAGPSNTTLPAISGTLTVGQPLTASEGMWTGAEPITFAFQWQRCDQVGADCAEISGATSAAYVLQGADAGSTIRIAVTATDSGGVTTATSQSTSVVIGQQAYLKASNTGLAHNFGYSVAVSGNTMVVGAYSQGSGAGAAYVFTRSGNTWMQQAYLKASNAGGSDRFGFSVGISGDTIVVGAYSEDSNATGVNGNESDNTATDSGAAYVFTRSGTTWTQQAYLKASNTDGSDWFGRRVAISGDTIVVVASQEDSNATGVNGNQSDNTATNSGAAYVFTRSGTTWTQQAYLKASNSAVEDGFGYSVDISDDTIVVGAYAEDSNATGVNGNESDNSAANSGAAYVFTRSGTTWTQQAYLKASNTEAADWFGYAVTISGNTIVAGAAREGSNATGVNGDQTNNSALISGAAYVFARTGTTWTQQGYLKASNTEDSDRFGNAVAISADTVVVGAELEDSNATGINGNETDNAATSSGAAYVFTRSGTTWTQQAYLKASNTEAGDSFGSAVAISAATIVVGAYLEDSNATGVNGDQTNNSLSASGAAYAFVVRPNPANSTLPAITGTTSVGQTLTASNGTWSYTPTGYAYQWRRCDSSGATCSDIGTNSSTYTLTAEDAGSTIRVAVTATNATGSTTATSTASAVVTAGGFAPVNTSPPTFTGTTTVGQTLTASNGTWSYTPTGYAYQWLRCDALGNKCKVIITATGSTYALVGDDTGSTIRVAVTASNSTGSATATSSASGPIASALTNSALPLITGNPTVGQTLSTSVGTWSHTPTSYAYVWLRCDTSGNNCRVISGASASRYRLKTTDAGFTIRVTVTAASAYGPASAISPQTPVVQRLAR